LRQMMENRLERKDAGELVMTRADFETIKSVLYRATGISLSDKKEQLVYSRLSKRLRKLGLLRFDDYCQILKADHRQEELGLVIQALTTNVTRFYREPHHFEILRNEILPALTQKARRGGKVRIWSAGCSAGQEPYSIAMEVLEWLPDAAQLDVKILATDIDNIMIETGRRGIYTDHQIQNVTPERLSRYFTKLPNGEGWQVHAGLRNLVSFQQLNLFDPWPMQGRFEAIFCRNVVIYFDVEDQVKLWNKFAAQMAPGGWLIIGHSERISGPPAKVFEPSGITAFRLNQPRNPLLSQA
ncbi:MAG: protein-glutamate O-methyltransferase CheR, partial [Pseudomonadota bacterium]